jgi:hypothetical protein
MFIHYAFVELHRIVMNHSQLENNRLDQPTTFFRQQMLKEIRENK